MKWENKVIVTLHSDSTESLYTGDIVTGIITLNLEKDTKVERIDLEITGMSKAMWTRFSPTIPYLKIYTEKKKIFCFKQDNLFYDALIDKRMQAGIHCHPFHFALPHGLPSTFTSSIASVNYYIKITSKPSCKVKKHVTFNVLANVNLNNIDDMLKPVTYKFQRSFRSTSKVLVTLKTYNSFSPRQIIPFEVQINNEKQIKIKKISLTLIQKLRCTVSSGYADDERIVHQVNYKKIENTVVELCKFDMDIPQIAPSSINSTKPMIDISYDFKMEIFFSYHLNLVESIPVTVAAVPVIHYDF